MMNWHEAVDEMYKGNVVKYIGTVNGNVMTNKGCSFCMCRGVLFRYRDGKPAYRSDGAMVYDPDFRYELTGEAVDTRAWPTKPNIVKTPQVLDKETKSKLGYSRIGLGNV
jgi:hypothetical protein